ncbi:hypothetical protein FOZ62_022539, partial [Perkinsus olseni]
QKAAADEARKAQEAEAKAKADDMRKRDLGMPKASAGAAAVGYAAAKSRKDTEGGAKQADDERKEIEARNSRILWQMREEAAKKAHQRRQEAAAAEEDRLMQTAVQFHK